MRPKYRLKNNYPIRSHLKARILVEYRGGAKLQPAGILRYFEELKRGTNKEIGPKYFFEIASIFVNALIKAGLK